MLAKTPTKTRGILRRKDSAFVDDKSVLIYIMMRLVELRAAETGRTFYATMRDAAVEADITIGAPNGWFYGTTRRPFADTALAFCNALGTDLLRPSVLELARPGKAALRKLADR